MLDIGQVMKGRIKKRKLVRSAGATGELWTHKYNRIRSTATTRGDDGGCGNQPRDGFQKDTKLFKRGGMLQSKKGLSMSVRWVDATIADRDEVMKQDDMGHCGNRQLYG